MSPVLVRLTTPTSTDVGQWSVAGPAEFITRVFDKAQERRMQAPFLVSAPLSDAIAHALGIPSLAGTSGSMVLHDDGTTRFVPAPPGHLIVSGSGRTELDTEPARLEICRQWLERVERCQVELQTFAPAKSSEVTNWLNAEAAQAAALAAAVADLTPDTLAALSRAADIRHQAFIKLPPFTATQAAL